MISIIRLIRIAQEKSQIEVGSEAGVPQYRISLIERGVLATSEERKKISETLGCREEQIFFQGMVRFD